MLRDYALLDMPTTNDHTRGTVASRMTYRVSELLYSSKGKRKPPRPSPPIDDSKLTMRRNSLLAEGGHHKRTHHRWLSALPRVHHEEVATSYPKTTYASRVLGMMDMGFMHVRHATLSKPATGWVCA